MAAASNKTMLRFITCGSVDDGKSTLIGRLLLEANCIFDDQMQAISSESKKFGTQGERTDLALLVDGLQAEREQGITIDVAYRFFATDQRKFVVADTPGHEQYTRNMATGASTAQLAVILVDARKDGRLAQIGVVVISSEPHANRIRVGRGGSGRRFAWDRRQRRLIHRDRRRHDDRRERH